MTPQEWPFFPYEKIPERLELDESSWRALSRLSWVVTEKIHGANFVLVTDGSTVRAANRKAYLDDEDDFFGHRAVLVQLVSRVRALYAMVKQEQPDTVLLFVYGELYGGGYPHPDVEPVANVQPIQTGVYYAPGIEFCAFDLGLFDGQTLRLMDYEAAVRHLQSVSIRFAQPLLIGKYEAASNFPLERATAIPDEHGLPRLPNNWAEGVVVKPWQTPDGLTASRPAVKRKIAAFAETRFHAADRRSPDASLATRLTQASNSFCTPQRLASALSKVGRVKRSDKKRREELRDELVEDVFAELAANHAVDWKRLPERDRDALRNHVEAQAESLIEARLT